MVDPQDQSTGWCNTPTYFGDESFAPRICTQNMYHLNPSNWSFWLFCCETTSEIILMKQHGKIFVCRFRAENSTFFSDEIGISSCSSWALRFQLLFHGLGKAYTKIFNQFPVYSKHIYLDVSAMHPTPRNNRRLKAMPQVSIMPPSVEPLRGFGITSWWGNRCWYFALKSDFHEIPIQNEMLHITSIQYASNENTFTKEPSIFKLYLEMSHNLLCIEFAWIL